MHDLTYAYKIIGSLKSKLKNRNRCTKTVINVYLSPLSHVAPERLRDIVSMLLDEGGFTNVKLNINILEFCVHCNKCGKTWKSAKPTFKCPECDSADFELKKYEEFYIDSIEIEE